MLTDQELQSLRNLGNEAEAAEDEIAELRDAVEILRWELDATKRARAATEAECARLSAELVAERERCARICEQYADDEDEWRPLDKTRGAAVREVARRIRAA